MSSKFVVAMSAFVVGCLSPVDEQDLSAEGTQAVPEALQAAPTVGVGDIKKPAVGPKPAYAYGKDVSGYVLVKNWDFGKNGTIRSIADLNEHFRYHDQFDQIANGGGKYGAYTVAPDREHALDASQPVEGVDTSSPVRKFFDNSMRTYLVGLNGAKNVNPATSKAGCGSFQARWKLPAAARVSAVAAVLLLTGCTGTAGSSPPATRAGGGRLGSRKRQLDDPGVLDRGHEPRPPMMEDLEELASVGTRC